MRNAPLAVSLRDRPYGVSCPPLDGSLFLPEMVEFNAKRNPTHPFYVFYDEHIDKLRQISHLEFYRACQRVAHAVRPNRRGPGNTTVGVIVACDSILYHALTMGLIYAGLIPFPISPRNSSAAVVDMMQKTGCRRLIATRHSFGPLLDGITAALRGVQIEDPPTLAFVYPKLGEETESNPFVPYPKAEERPLGDDILYYLHSSGSSGFPRPIPMTNSDVVRRCIAPSVRQHVNLPKHITICAASLPPFHAIGTVLLLLLPIASLKSIAVYPPTSYHDPTIAPVIPNPQNVIETVQSTKSNSLFVVPTFLEEWVNSRQAIDVLRSLDYVLYGGGPLAPKTGDALAAAGVSLGTAYGATEFGPITYFIRDPAEKHLWEWVRFGPDQSIRWAPQGNGMYECQVLTSPAYRASVENLTDVRGYASGDAFVKHPTIEGLYKIVGRLDDVLIHSSGEKTVPAPMETVIASSPILSGVCMFGRGRNLAGVLVEPKPEHAIDVTDDKQLTKLRNNIWREVEEANKKAPAFSRIFKEMILVTSREKPMQRASKGAVMKKATMALYELEIDALYASLDTNATAGVDVPLPASWSQVEVENWLMAHAAAVNEDKPVDAAVDVFEQGFDSLSSTFFKNRVLGSLGASPHQEIREGASRIGPNVVFAYPILRRLASHLIECMDGKDANPLPAPDMKTEIESMISKYVAGLEGEVRDSIPRSTHGHTHHGHVVLLTGSTGGLGSYLLASLLSRDEVAAVYAYNRPSKTKTIQQRQRASFADRGLDVTLLDSEKLIYVEGDLAQANLSLDDKTYGEIRDGLTAIVHNAWRVDFNLALSSFEPYVRGTRNLIDLARGSKRAEKPRFMFMSSVGSARGWNKTKGAFPEEVQLDAEVAGGSGYGAGKYVCERILARSGLSASSFRIGQITGGAPRGAWSPMDWVPTIVKSSVTLGAFPEALGVVSWLPVEAVTNAILDVVFGDEEPPIAVNLVHPQPAAWESVMHTVREAVYEKRVTAFLLPSIPFGEWVERLEAHATADKTSEATLRRLPAIKLIGFMRALAEGDAETRRSLSLALISASGTPTREITAEVGGLASFETTVARRVSKTMRELAALSAADTIRWVDYWLSVGMFSEDVPGRSSS